MNQLTQKRSNRAKNMRNQLKAAYSALHERGLDTLLLTFVGALILLSVTQGHHGMVIPDIMG